MSPKKPGIPAQDSSMGNPSGPQQAPVSQREGVEQATPAAMSEGAISPSQASGRTRVKSYGAAAQPVEGQGLTSETTFKTPLPTTEFLCGGTTEKRIVSPAFFAKVMEKLPLDVRNGTVDAFLSPETQHNPITGEHKIIPGEWLLELRFYQVAVSGMCSLSDPAEVEAWRERVQANLDSKMSQTAMQAEATLAAGRAAYNAALSEELETHKAMGWPQRGEPTPPQKAIIDEPRGAKWERTMGEASRTASPLVMEALAWYSEQVDARGSVEAAFDSLIDGPKPPVRNDFKVTFEDGNTLTTGLNGDLAEAKAYYLGKRFNFGDNAAHPKDKMVKAVMVEQLFTIDPAQQRALVVKLAEDLGRTMRPAPAVITNRMEPEALVAIQTLVKPGGQDDAVTRICNMSSYQRSIANLELIGDLVAQYLIPATKDALIEKQEDPERYLFAGGLSMQRETSGTTPSGNPIGGRWVLRSQDGDWIDCDRYRDDLAARHDLALSEPSCLRTELKPRMWVPPNRNLEGNPLPRRNPPMTISRAWERLRLPRLRGGPP